MRTWLEVAIESMSLTDEAEGYLFSRGAKTETISDLGITVWDHHRITAQAPDKKFCEEHGAYGEKLSGSLATPVFSPSGRVIGMEWRAFEGPKRISQCLLLDASWNPVFVGLNPRSVRKIWDGARVWIVEGMFDLTALQHGVPEEDVVLSTMRAHLSFNHISFLRRVCSSSVMVVYDNDRTGKRMTHGYTDDVTGKRIIGAVESLNRVGVKSRAVSYTGGKDPGEIWDRGGARLVQTTFCGSEVNGGNQ